MKVEDNVMAIELLEREYGEFYEELIELEWDMNICYFIQWFWDCENKCFNI